MNTKFDVGQRVTYPVVHTADGNITGIAVSKAGVTRYAIGPKWYTEDDLKLTAEENAVTEPVAESKPEPVKLYCAKSYKPGEWFTKGKVYETDCKDNFTTDDGYQPHGYEWREDYTLGEMPWSYYLVPLTRRPAKVGEWVYFTEYHGGPLKPETVHRATSSNEICVSFEGYCCSNPDHYLVLDGYHGDPA